MPRGKMPAVRRLRRILRGTATGLSAGLCVATVVFWALSYNREYGVVWWRADGNGSLYIERGRFHWHVSPGPSYMYRGDETDFAAVNLWQGEDSFPMIGRPWFRFAGFGYASYQNGPTWDREAIVPLWLAVALFAIPPAAAVRRRRALRGQRVDEAPHRCPACGYDLRATPHRCPECGWQPS
jgi:hypothetical protein